MPGFSALSSGRCFSSKALYAAFIRFSGCMSISGSLVLEGKEAQNVISRIRAISLRLIVKIVIEHKIEM